MPALIHLLQHPLPQLRLVVQASLAAGRNLTAGQVAQTFATGTLPRLAVVILAAGVGAWVRAPRHPVIPALGGCPGWRGLLMCKRLPEECHEVSCGLEVAGERNLLSRQNAHL